MRGRRGSALILVLVVTLAVAGLAASAIFLSSSANLLSANTDRVREYRFAAIAALDRAVDTLRLHPTLQIPAVGKRKVLDAVTILDAAGQPLPRLRVTVWGAEAGLGAPGSLPTFALVAVVDDGGVRYAHRYDLRRESFASFAHFVNGDAALGPAVVPGRAHANGTYTMLTLGRALENIILDSVSATGTINLNKGTARDTVQQAPTIPYPTSTFAELADSANIADLLIDNRAASAKLSRVEFLVRDLNTDGDISRDEAFLGVFDFAALASATDSAAMGTRRRRAVQPWRTFSGNKGAYRMLATDAVVVHQCGAFYRRARTPSSATTLYDWHFLPVSSHWKPGFATLLVPSVVPASNNQNFPTVVLADVDQPTEAEIWNILTLPTARCFSPGSPYLMPAERFTGAGTDTPWGVGTGAPANGNWANSWYGGMDTTFTATVRTCEIYTGTPNAGSPAPTTGGCFTTSGGKALATTPSVLGTWRAFPGTWRSGRQPTDPFLKTYGWPLDSLRNARRVNGAIAVHVPTTDSLYVSGTVRGRFTLWTDRAAVLVDRLLYAQDPNGTAEAGCANQLGLLAVGDILVVNGLTARVHERANAAGEPVVMAGGEPRFTVHGALMSLRGTVAPMFPDSIYAAERADQYDCPAGPTKGISIDDSNGGCFAVTGGIIMNTSGSFYGNAGAGGSSKQARKQSFTGMRYAGTWDQCGRAPRRPPFFPLTNRFRVLRSSEVNVQSAKTESALDALFAALRVRVY